MTRRKDLIDEIYFLYFLGIMPSSDILDP